MTPNYTLSLLVTITFIIISAFIVTAEISSGRIKGDDEPHIVSWRVLEGITEPFESNQQDAIPPWKQMKNAADQKAASMAVQQALHEYGQLLRHPYMFGDMPMEERYDVFLSMSKLLKMMGFHQRAELLLYEAMSYTTDPHEAHLQLALLFLDKEDLEKTKMHLKNCLFYKESDILILIHLSVILIAEGRTHEAKFFLGRILSGLETRIKNLPFILRYQGEKDIQQSMSAPTDPIDFKVLTNWVEDLIVKVFYGEFRVTPAATAEMFRYFSNLYQWLSADELTGRFIFDLGQSLYEGGRPRVGQMMMRRGFETSDPDIEGEVSTAIVNMRLAFDYPVVPDSLLDILESYLNMTAFLLESSQQYYTIELENILDLYWPLPLLAWSGLPMMPVMKELMWRFEGGPHRTDALSRFWLNESSYDEIIEGFHPRRDLFTGTRLDTLQQAHLLGSSDRSSGNSDTDAAVGHGLMRAGIESNAARTSAEQVGGQPLQERFVGRDADPYLDPEQFVGRYDTLVAAQQKARQKQSLKSGGSMARAATDLAAQAIVIPPATQGNHQTGRAPASGDYDENDDDYVEESMDSTPFNTKISRQGSPISKRDRSSVRIEVGIMGGHMNNHPVGQMVFWRIVGLSSSPSSAGSASSGIKWRDLIRLTLIALPLVPDSMTRRIASSVDKIVNLPMDTTQAWRIIENLHLDVIIFPDWQPFPDQQSALFQTRRMAPVQICFFVRGGSCVSDAVDYYLMPAELQNAYLNAIPAAAVDAKITVKRPSSPKNKQLKRESGKASKSGDLRGRSSLIPREGSADTSSLSLNPNDVSLPEHENPDLQPGENISMSRSSGDSFAQGIDGTTTSASVGEVIASERSMQAAGRPMRAVRPQWKELYSEQIVLLDWPILTPKIVHDVAATISYDEAAAQNRRTQASSGGHGTTSASPYSFSSASSRGAASGASSGGSRSGGGGGGSTSTSTSSDMNQGRQILDDSASSLLFSPLEIEGKVFFDGQPVAVLPVHPTYLNPIMDDTIFKIMRAVPSLHIVLALPETFFMHVQRDIKHKVSWARKLVRRLWARGGNLYHRIRLLPAPLSDQRLLQLLRQADMVLDTFPIGGSFYFLSLALSVGTSVVTLQSGTPLHSSKEDLKELRSFIMQHRQQDSVTTSSNNNNSSSSGGGGMRVNHYARSPMSQQVAHLDLPWTPATTALGGFYKALGLQQYFLANSTAQYFQLASNLATNREFAYGLRIKVLEAIDRDSGGPSQQSRLIGEGSKGGAGGGSSSSSSSSSSESYSHTVGGGSGSGGTLSSEWDEFLAEEGEIGALYTTTISSNIASGDSIASDNENNKNLHEASSGGNGPPRKDSDSDSLPGSSLYSLDCGHCVDDLGRFLVSVATPFARARDWQVHSEDDSSFTRNNLENGEEKRSRRKKRSRTGKSDGSFLDELEQPGAGAILQ